MFGKRRSGVLLHITSLPNRFCIGDLGPSAYRFADFLVDSHQQFWQILPLVPIGYGNSPYSSPSTFAGNDLLISPEVLVEQGLLHAHEVEDLAGATERVDYDQARSVKKKAIASALRRFDAGQGTIPRDEFDAFVSSNGWWLDDYALFAVISEANAGSVWTSWNPTLRDREPRALESFRQDNEARIRHELFAQFLFRRQWSELRRYCNGRGISMIGDIPIYVAHDSADVWANPDLFHLDEDGHPIVVSGVPPDYFSETGQRWGNPLYRWDLIADRGFSWWVDRVRATFELVDIIRMDHFRGFEAFWEVPAEEETAVKGRWVKGPGSRLFKTLREALGNLPIIAEDLGLITDEVVQLKREFDLPGMAILQFAFDGGPDDAFLPHNYERNTVAYTGTHDNDTVVGWYTGAEGTLGEEVNKRARLFCNRYLGIQRQEEVHTRFIRALMASVAETVIFPVQDLLGLGKEARMNTPGEAAGNWTWHFDWSDIPSGLAESLSVLTVAFGRSSRPESLADLLDRT